MQNPAANTTQNGVTKFKFSVILNINLNSYKLYKTQNKSFTVINNATHNIFYARKILDLRTINKF